MIERERTCDISAPRKCYQADAVVRAPIDKALQHILGNLQSIDLRAFDFEARIFRSHAAGEIDGHGNIDAAGHDFRFTFGQLRTRQRHNEKDQCKPAQSQQPAACARFVYTRKAPHQRRG